MKRIFMFLSFAICTTLLFAQPLVSTWVGTGAPGVISGGVPRLSAGLDMPYGVTMDSKGNLWLSEEGGNGYGFVIKMVQPDGTARVRAGGVSEDCFKNGASTAARFSQPRGLAVDASDNIYVADYGNCVIRKIDKFMSVGSSQWVSVFAGKWDTTFACYISHPGYANGTLKTAQFNGPSDIAFDKTTGAMYVADAMNHCIRKIYNGQVTTVAGHPDSAGFRDGATGSAKFNFPTGVFVDANGDVYVADHMNSRIRKISGGIVSSAVPLSAGLWTPDDVWVTANGDIYITDQHRIRKYSVASSTLSTFAGSSMPNDNGNVDGYGTDARFDNVKCMIADNSNPGMFFVADQSNHKIRKVVTCASYKPLITVSGGQQTNDSSYATCTGDTIYLETTNPYPSYKWSTGEITRKIFTTSTKIISCTVTNNDGCQGTSDNNYINISPLSPKITPTGPTTFCPGDSVILVGPNGYDWYKWTKDGTTFEEGHIPSIKIHSDDLGDYVLHGTLGYCEGSSSIVKVATSTQIVPTINIIKGDSNLCTNDTLILESSTTYTTYTWKKDGTAISGATSKSVSITTAGNYSLDVSKAGGCSGTSYPIHVVIIPAPPTPTFTISHDTLTSSKADSYQWYLNNKKITSAIQRGYIAKQSGSYSVEIIDTSNGCRARSLPQVVTLSILELSGGLRFEVFPNPTNGKLTVTGTIKTSGDFNIRVVDLLGKSVINNILNLNPGRFEKQIDLQGNPSGIYFVIISSNGNQGMMKLILK